MNICKGLVFEETRLPNFTCLKCGECCDSTPSITMSDVERLASDERANLEVLREVRVAFPVIKEGSLSVIEFTSPIIISPKISNNKCVFYNKGCSIHERKPGECRLNPFAVMVQKKKDFFIAKPFIPNYCEGIKGRAPANFLTKSFISHLIEMIQHEYFVLNLKVIPDSINELLSLWSNRESKDLFEMLSFIYDKNKESGLVFRTCC